jgi:hypothetical protein
MPPRKNHVYCTCSTHGCGAKEYKLNGAFHRGGLVSAKTAHYHALDDQAAQEESELPLDTLDLLQVCFSSACNNIHPWIDHCVTSLFHEPVLPDQPNNEAQGPTDTAIAAVTQSLSRLRMDAARPSQPPSLGALDTCM